MPFSRFTLGPQTNQQIISITGGAVPAIYFRDQRVTMEQLGPLLDAAKREGLINHHQGGPFHFLRNGCRSDKRCA